jgi:predicted kinase
VLACLQAGKPVFVNAPVDPRKFAHHAAYRAQIDGERLIFLDCAAAPEAAAEQIAARCGSVPQGPDVDFDRCWGMLR